MPLRRIVDLVTRSLIKLSLRQILSIGVAFGILLPALLFSQLFLGDRFRREIDVQVREPMSQSADMLAQTMSVALWNVDRAVANQTVQAVMRNPDVVRVAVTDEVGNSFVDVDMPARRLGLVLQDKRPVQLGDRVIGQVMIEMSTARVNSDLFADFLKLVGALVAQVVISFVLILLLFEYRVVRPLRFLQRATERLASGDLKQAVKLRRVDEIGSLAQGLDDMRAELGALLAERDSHNANLQLELNERLKAEQALRTTEAKFTAIFQTAPLAMIVARIEDGFVIADVNDIGLQQFEVKRADVVQGNAGAFSIWKDPADSETLIKIVREKGAVDGFEGG